MTMKPITPIKCLIICGITLASALPSGASANAIDLNVQTCHLAAIENCPLPFSDEAFDQCYVSAYNMCVLRRFLLKPPLRNH